MTTKIDNISAIIPARYGSTRLPGKPLLDFNGKPMLQWVYETCVDVFEHVAVATDDKLIHDAVEGFGGHVVMTDENHENGTSRVSEALKILDWGHSDYILNVQGDEPMISTQTLTDLTSALMESQADIGTLIAKVNDEKELFGESEVFVVKDVKGRALYFSRAIIPFFNAIPQDQWLEHGEFWKHLGLYAYKPDVLHEIANIPTSVLESAEGLEQNRWLEHGYHITVAETVEVSYPVDTPDDVEFVRNLMKKFELK